MRIVGDHLRTHACGLASGADFDLFARSAFNRYYYAAFWITRRMLQDLGQPNDKLRHESIPEHITGKFRRNLLNEASSRRKSKVITSKDEARIKANIESATRGIAKVLTSAYLLRCAADYNADARAVCTLSDIRLMGSTGKDARNWVRDTESYCTTLQKAWRNLGH